MSESINEYKHFQYLTIEHISHPGECVFVGGGGVGVALSFFSSYVGSGPAYTVHPKKISAKF